MSTTYGQLTPRMVTLIQKKLVSASYTNAEMLGWFKAIGNIRNIGKGMLKHTVTKFEKMEPGEIIIDLSALPTNVPRFTDQTTNLITLGVKLAIPLNVMDAYVNNQQIDIDLNQIIEEQLKAFTEQIDQFLAYGDSFITPHTGDKNAGEGFSNGIFNGGTTFAAGDGADNNMAAAGDYQSTISLAIQALETAGFKQKTNYVFSDNVTYHHAERGNHQLNVTEFTNEIMAIEKNPLIASWIYSTHFIGSAGINRILVTTPWIKRVPREVIGPVDDKSSFAYRLIQGYNLDVYPLYAGGLGPSGRYEFYILWSGALEFLRAGAIQVSGTLVFT